MRKVWFSVGMIFLLVPWLLVGCGVSGEEYSKVVLELASTQQELQSVKNESAAAQTELAAAQAELEAAQVELEVAQAELVKSEETASTLEAELQTANSETEKLRADVAAQQKINSSLSDELKKITYPRHFQSLTELTDWLRQDDTNIEYAGEGYVNLCYILQVKALRDGYLLPVSIDDEPEAIYYSNAAVIEDELHYVWPDDDYSEFVAYVQPLPSRPISPD